MNRLKRQKSEKTRYKDDADLFREQSLRAIRRRKLWSKYLFWALLALAVAVTALAAFVCLADY